MNKVILKTPKNLHAFLSCAPLNIAFHAGKDSKETINANRTSLISPFTLENLAYLEQIHGDCIIQAQSGGFLGQGDGILITQKGIIGLIMVADCNPILLFDTKQNLLILLHAGRVGLQKGILKNALNLLQTHFATNPKDLFVFVGPSIRACCYEVGIEVFSDSNLDSGKRIRQNKIYLDLTAIILKQLKEANVTNFTIDSTCTCCNNRYFSYRRDSSCGRFGLFAYLQ